MSDKFLTESEWKKFAKGRGYKDDGLIKALASLDKAKGPEQELAALAEIDKQAEILRKAGKGDKELVAYLDGLDKAAEKQRKLSEAEAKKSEQEADEEEESPTLLTSKMIPLLRQVKKGDEMQVMLAGTGKDVAVLMSRRAIAPTRRKLLAEYLDGATPKYFLGTCIFEENAYTFVLKTQAAGLAKKVRAALLKQVELRLKVRVRGEDPNDIDDDGEPLEGNEGQESEGEEGNAGTKGNIPPPPPPPPVDPLKAQFDKRWADLQARVLAQLKAGIGDVSKLRAVAEFVREKGEGANYKAALQGMDSLEKLLQPGTVPQSPEPKVPDPTAAFTARLAALMPAVKNAIAEGGETGQGVKLKVSEAGVFARKKEFDQANALLDEAEALMGSEAGGSTTEEQGGVEEESEDQTATGNSPEQQRWEKAFAEVEPEYLALLAKQPADANKLRAVMGYANQQAEAGQFAKAAAALDQLRKLMAVAQPEDIGAGDTGRLVRQRRFMLERWAKLPPQLRSHLGPLRKAVADSGADDDPDGLVDAIEAELDALLDELQDELDSAINAGSTAGLRGVRARFENNELVQHLRTGPGIDGGKLLTAVLEAVDEIESEMTSA